MLKLTKNYYIQSNNASEIVNIAESVQEKLTKANIKHKLKLVIDETFKLKIKIKCNE